MEFSQLKLFLDVLQNQSFIRAAEKNHMSASTLSRQIQRMEADVGQPLFIRDNRQVRLTEAGERFRQFAEHCWLDWLQIKRSISPEKGELTGELTLFCSVTASYSHLPSILARFRQSYPLVDIKLSTGDPAKALHNVMSMQVDLSLAGKPDLLPPSVAFHYIDDISLSLIAPRVACQATQLLQSSPLNWQQMPFILPNEGMARKRMEQWFKLQKLKTPHIYATVAGHEAIVPMVALGCGVAMLPDVVIEHSPMKNQVSRLHLPDPIQPFELGICVQQRRLQEPIIQAFWQLLN